MGYKRLIPTFMVYGLLWHRMCCTMAYYVCKHSMYTMASTGAYLSASCCVGQTVCVLYMVFISTVYTDTVHLDDMSTTVPT